MKLSHVVAALCCCAGIPLVCGAESGVVSANSLNARLRPELKSPVMMRLVKGDKVEITGKEGEFYRIALPENAPVYISAVYISGNRTLKALNMRCQNASNAASYGVLPQGSEIKPISQDSNGWAKIAPPAGLSLYAARFYIEAVSGEDKPAEVKTPAADTAVPEAAKPETKVEPATAPEVKPESKPVETAPVAETKPAIDESRMAQLKSLEIDPATGEAASVTGMLVPLKASAVPGVGYALLDAGRKLVTFVNISDEAAAPLLDKNVKLSGVSFKVPNWKNPVLAATGSELVQP